MRRKEATEGMEAAWARAAVSGTALATAAAAGSAEVGAVAAEEGQTVRGPPRLAGRRLRR